MQIPLPLRALFRKPTRWVAALLTRHPAFWVPSDTQRPRAWADAFLRSARTPQAVRAAMTDGSTFYPTNATTERVGQQQAMSLALHAGHLSPALLDWCVRWSADMKVFVRHLHANPAVTPREMRVLRRALEERVWLEVVAERLGNIEKLFRRHVTVYHPLFSELLVAWLSATHPDEVPDEAWDDWTPFMADTVAQHLGHRDVLSAALARPTIPAVVLQEVRRLVDADHGNAMREACRNAPRILTIEEINAVLNRRHQVADVVMSRSAVIVEMFDVLPVPLRERYWHDALTADPARVAPLMVAMSGATPGGLPGARWPGLTAEGLAPLLVHEDAEVRLSAIQLLSGFQKPEMAPHTATSDHGEAGVRPELGGEGVGGVRPDPPPRDAPEIPNVAHPHHVLHRSPRQ